MSKRRTGSVNLADLTNAIGENSPVDGKNSFTSRRSTAAEEKTATTELADDPRFLACVPVEKLIANPHNPRDRMGDLEDLATIVDYQLQPGTAVTRSSWLSVYPDDLAAIGSADYIVINGCRRLAAARHFGRGSLDIVVRDDLAENQATVVTAAVLENIARENLDVIEEAKAIELLVSSMSSAAAAARKLHRTGAWVSQRRALLNLAPELQEALRRGELGVREARSFAKVPLDTQVETWLAELKKRENPQPEQSSKDDAEDKTQPEKIRPVAKIVRALKGTKANPETTVAALEEFFTPEDLVRIGTMLAQKN